MKLKSMLMLTSIVAANVLYAGVTYTAPVSKVIEKSYNSGDIDHETYVIESLKAFFAPTEVDKEFRSKGYGESSTRMITPLLVEAKKIYPSLKTNDKEFVDALLKRPTDTTHEVDGVKMYLPEPVEVFEPTKAEYPHIGGKFKFWYVTHAKSDAGGNVHTTTLAKVKAMAATFDNVYAQEVGTMKFDAPPHDTGSKEEGGDTKFDVYLMNTGKKGIYGFVAPEDLASSGDENERYSYMVMDNDFKEFAPTTPDEAMKVTAAHEYHHAIQMGINANADTWYMEATSTWMEEKVYDDINDNRQYIKNVMEHPEIPLDTKSDHWYAEWIFNEYLGQRWGNSIVKDVWTELDAVGNDNAVKALDRTLHSSGKDASFKTLYNDFWAKNYQKDTYYDEGTHWEAAAIVNKNTPHILDYSTDESNKISEQALTLKHESSKLYKFVPGGTLLTKTTLNIQVKTDNKDNISVKAVAQHKDGTYLEYPLVLNEEGKGEIGVPGFDSIDVGEVVLVITNHSLTEDDINVNYTAYLAKPITFVIDDTGSMGDEISAAKEAIKTVLTTNKASGKHYFYSLLSYKDGLPTLRGQSSNEDEMIALADTLYASGGAGCPESAFISIREATKLAENSDIYIMTDADSNSYGKDGTYATWGELWETVESVISTNSHVHAIIYGECWRYASKTNSNSGQQESCSDSQLLGKVLMKKDYASGMAGYKEMSGETGGLYFKATASTTEEITEIILNHSSADATVMQADINGSHSFSLPIDKSISKFEVVANVKEGVTATMKLTDPDGNVVTTADEGVSAIDVSGSSFYLIDGAAVKIGNWNIEVNATGEFTLASKGFSSSLLTYVGDMATGVGGELNMKLAIEDDVANPKFYLVDLSDGSKKAEALTKVGKFYIGKTIMEKSGSYRILVEGDNYYQRVYPSKIDVNEVYIDAPLPEILPPAIDSNITYSFAVENKSDEDSIFTIEATSTMGWADLSKFPMDINLSAGSKEEIKIDVNVSSEAKSGDIDLLSVTVYDKNNPTIRSVKSVETRIATMYDLDEDGDVDVTDIMMVAGHWGAKKGDKDYSLTIDLNDDGYISVKDIMMVAGQWGWTK